MFYRFSFFVGLLGVCCGVCVYSTIFIRVCGQFLLRSWGHILGLLWRTVGAGNFSNVFVGRRRGAALEGLHHRGTRDFFLVVEKTRINIFTKLIYILCEFLLSRTRDLLCEIVSFIGNDPMGYVV